MGIFGTGITQCAQEFGLLKAGLPKLGQEGAAFLSAGNSGKPVGFIGLSLCWERFSQD
jgi:hypothetical protein